MDTREAKEREDIKEGKEKAKRATGPPGRQLERVSIIIPTTNIWKLGVKNVNMDMATKSTTVGIITTLET